MVDQEPQTVRQAITIAASTDDVLAVVTDFDAYPSWQSEVEQAAVTTRDAQARPLRVTMVTAAMGMKSFAEIELEYLEDGVKWHLVDGNMLSRNDCEYRLRANSGGGTDVELTMSLALKINLPDFVMKHIVTKGISENLSAIKRAAEAG